MVTDLDWLSVYKVTRVKGKVQKVKHVCPELYEECTMLHQKVHQEIMVNNELSIVFVRVFAYKNCTFVKEETNQELYRLAWALSCEASIEHCRKMGNLQQKMARCWSMAVDDAIPDSQQILKER